MYNINENNNLDRLLEQRNKTRTPAQLVLAQILCINSDQKIYKSSTFESKMSLEEKILSGYFKYWLNKIILNMFTTPFSMAKIAVIFDLLTY